MENPDPNLLAKKPDNHELFIVGIGASAGGVEALTSFFENAPSESGIAFVVILHLSPSYDSQLAQILQAVTPMPVSQVLEKTHIMANHVYVVPPNRHLEMMDGHINVSQNILLEERRAPVDIFFRSLAESHSLYSIAVILSGTGANGSMGIKRIKERGGAAFVQNPREALYNEMPRNSIATGLIDDVLNVADIPAKIVAYRNGFCKIPPVAKEQTEDHQHALRDIFTRLRFHTGHDFSNYKRATLLRRIERRIIMRNLPNLPAYATYLRDNPDETQLLLKDLLISVTNFFRDKAAFKYIENEMLPLILKNKKQGDTIRIWVAGCATGEEAYSLAMLCAERTLGIFDAPKVQIFATDIDEAAVSAGREGLYTINDAADISEDRLRRFFNKEGNEYRVRRDIREMILFAVQNVLKDPPFSHIDLISCRNLLIYLNQTAQQRVMETFHFALNPTGWLFLGNSESAGTVNDLYAQVSREFHLYQSRLTGIRSYPVPESIPSFNAITLNNNQKNGESEKNTPERISYGDLHQRLLEQYAPPSVIVNEDHEILHMSESAGQYLQISGGEPSRDLLKLVKPELRLELRTALYQAVQRQVNVETGNMAVPGDENQSMVNIYVRPVLQSSPDTARGFLLVLFETNNTPSAAEVRTLMSDEPMARQMEQELIRVKAQLRAAREQFELQAEEMKASNEELQALNEELRSAAEELETGKEELQSINEELTTVNQELKVKIEETSLSSNNLQNLINSTDIGTIFLDRSFRVVLFTPAIRNIFNLIPADYGRPLSDITGQLDYKWLITDAEMALEKLTIIEREIVTDKGQVFLLRVLPYRTAEDRINGVVLTFVNVSAIKEAEQKLHENMHELTRFNQAMVTREIRMIELKKEVNDAYKKAGEPDRYPLDFENNENDA